MASLDKSDILHALQREFAEHDPKYARKHPATIRLVAESLYENDIVPPLRDLLKHSGDGGSLPISAHLVADTYQAARDGARDGAAQVVAEVAAPYLPTQQIFPIQAVAEIEQPPARLFPIPVPKRHRLRSSLLVLLTVLIVATTLLATTGGKVW